MSATLHQVLNLIGNQDVKVSAHGYDELAADGILVHDVMAGANDGVLIEDYPDYHKGPCVLVLEYDGDGKPIHVLWGIPKNATYPAVLITAYRPDPGKWSGDFQRRKQ